ncbi:hypothetical protein [Allohahella sp. A8]|uniref:hypothetical protein n=1 Tax=Allohahella sp. A8 TaxID=3141461 RepID=UPI003A7FA7BF
MIPPREADENLGKAAPETDPESKDADANSGDRKSVSSPTSDGGDISSDQSPQDRLREQDRAQAASVRSGNIFAAAAVFISLLALGVSIWQGILSREHNRLSLAPHLQVSPRLQGDGETGLYLENSGTGSAFIQSATISDGSKVFDLTANEWPQFLQHLGINPQCFRNNWLRPAAAILAGKEFNLLKISDAEVLHEYCSVQMRQFFLQKGVKLTIAYTSIYEDHYRISEEFAFKESDLANLPDFMRIFK